MRCPKCGNNLNDNERVCDFCGYLVIQEPKNIIKENNFVISNDNSDYEEKNDKKSVDVVKIFFIVAVIACIVYLALVGMRWLSNKDANSKKDSTPVQNTSLNTETEKKEEVIDSKTQNAEETIIENNGYKFVIPAYYNVYKNTEAYVELINNLDKVNIVMYKPLEMEYDLIKSAPESYIVDLQEKGMTLLQNVEKFYNNNRYYVIYCKNGNNNYYQVFTSFYGKTLSFGINDFGSNLEDDLFDVIDMILTGVEAIS